MYELYEWDMGHIDIKIGIYLDIIEQIYILYLILYII